VCLSDDDVDDDDDEATGKPLLALTQRQSYGVVLHI
jgi:hypothetical protein